MEAGQLQEELAEAPTLAWAVQLAVVNNVPRFTWGQLDVFLTIRNGVLTKVRTEVITDVREAEG